VCCVLCGLQLNTYQERLIFAEQEAQQAQAAAKDKADRAAQVTGSQNTTNHCVLAPKL